MSKCFKLQAAHLPPPSQQQRQTGYYASYAKKRRHSHRQDHPRIHAKGSSCLTGHLRKFSELWMLPNSFLSSRLDEGSGSEAALSANNARFHKTCKPMYNKTKLQIWIEEPENRRWRKTKKLLPASELGICHDYHVLRINTKKWNASSAEKLLVVLIFVTGSPHWFRTTWTTWCNWTRGTWLHRRPSTTESVQ